MIKTLARQIKEYKRASLVTPIFMIMEVAMEMVIPLLMASIIDDGVQAGDMKHIFVIGCYMVLAAIVGLFAGVMGGKYGAKASTGFARNLREAMYENIQTFSFSNIDKFSTAGLVTRMTTDVTNIQNAYQMLLRMCFRAPVSLICAMLMAFLINAKVASIYLVAVVFLGIVMVFIMKKVSKYFSEVFKKYDDLNASVQENVAAQRVVKAYVREDYEIDKFHKASYNIYKMFKKAECTMVMVWPVMQFTVYGCILGISWLGAHMIIASQLTTGELMSLLTYCMTILMNLMMLAMIFVMMTMSAASARRIAEVLEEKTDITNPEQPDYDVTDGSIRFDHVTFRYNKQSEKPVLDDLNFEIKAGETIGILGGTGSSKTSLVNLISRLYDVNEGTVYVGGKDVRNYDLETLRNEVSVVLQKNVLFSGTILENLRWYRSRFPHRLRPSPENLPPVPEQDGLPAQRAEESSPAKPEKKETPPALPVLDLTADTAGLTDDQIRILQVLTTDAPLLTDDVAERADLPIRRVLSALTVLEIDGYATQHGARRFVRTVEIRL